MKIKVILKISDGTTEEFFISKSSFSLGRSKKNDLCLRSDGLSRKHCQFDLTPEGEIYITDFDSTNGVLIEGAKIKPGVPVNYPPFLSLTIGPIIGLEIVTLEGNDENAPLGVIKDDQKALDLKKKSANFGRQSKTEKNHPKLGIIILFVLLCTCILYVIFNSEREFEVTLPNSPKALDF
jgi:pSer/pThr/pTyr-binding forkhead associated (FHA) protein